MAMGVMVLLGLMMRAWIARGVAHLHQGQGGHRHAGMMTTMATMRMSSGMGGSCSGMSSRIRMRVALRVHHGRVRLLEGVVAVVAVRSGMAVRAWTSCGRHGGSGSGSSGSVSMRRMGMRGVGRHGGVVVVHDGTRRLVGWLVANERGEEGRRGGDELLSGL